MSEAAATRHCTYDDLATFPDDNHRRAIIGGELIVTPAPAPKHQDAVLLLGARLLTWTEEHASPGFQVAVDDVLGDSTPP